MIVTYKIEYRTNCNESIRVGDQSLNTAMHSTDGIAWSADQEINGSRISYGYNVVDGRKVVRSEWGAPRSVSFAPGLKTALLIDRWQDIPSDSSFYSSLFTQSLFRRTNTLPAPKLKKGCVMVAIDTPSLLPTQSLVMVGSCSELGSWDPSLGVKMADGDAPRMVSPSLKRSDDLIRSEYKFVIIDNPSGEVVAWESGENRCFCNVKDAVQESIYIVCKPAKFDTQPWRGAGVAIPVFSLRSENSVGVGEFLDLKKMVDWANVTGQKIIQILPINDTTMSHTWEDSYPYNANSIFALHPQYLSANAVAKLEDSALLKEFTEEGKRLNALDQIDYEAVNSLKDRWFKALFQQEGDKQMATKEFKQFFKDNKYWLEPYALFSYLRDKYQTPDFSKWEGEAKFSEQLLAKFTSKRSKAYQSLAYYYFVQYNLHIQLLDVKEYAHSKGVAFKGDIPIGVSRTSVDVWQTPRLFHLKSQAGAPPDDFSVLGQNWGFPTYNWVEMAKDGYAWWYARFSKMAEYFDAYRIDHILGFFRIWEIPLDAVHGLLGHFSPAKPYTTDEIANEYGFQFHPTHTKPYIYDWTLNEIFGDKKEDVITKYLENSSFGRYSLKSRYNTQAKIAKVVEDKEMSAKLMSLLDDVLFIEDPYNKWHYHPRISAHSTYAYRALDDWQRECYNRLYDNFFYYRHDSFWREEALKKLPTLISATSMLTCGEDLGMIPHCVPEVMSHEQILSLEIQRMPKDPRLTFGEPWNYPYLSVCTTSTHDMNPIRAWWSENRELSQRYYNEVLGFDGSAPEDCAPMVCMRILTQHLYSPAMWTILPLQDWLSIDAEKRNADAESERINIPANSRHYWRYRMHISIEELLSSTSFNTTLRSMITESGR